MAAKLNCVLISPMQHRLAQVHYLTSFALNTLNQNASLPSKPFPKYNCCNKGKLKLPCSKKIACMSSALIRSLRGSWGQGSLMMSCISLWSIYTEEIYCSIFGPLRRWGQSERLRCKIGPAIDFPTFTDNTVDHSLFDIS